MKFLSWLSIATFSRAELGKGGMGLDPNDATMGPIMDSLIMTSKTEPYRNSSFQIHINSSSQKWIKLLNIENIADDRPYVDCATLTPMTGTGLVKFER